MISTTWPFAKDDDGGYLFLVLVTLFNTYSHLCIEYFHNTLTVSLAFMSKILPLFFKVVQQL